MSALEEDPLCCAACDEELNGKLGVRVNPICVKREDDWHYDEISTLSVVDEDGYFCLDCADEAFGNVM